MTFQEFDTFQAELLAEVVKMKDTKGREYASAGDRFANFNQDALDNNINRLAAASIFLNKHMRSIKSYIRDGQTYSAESIRGRIVDAITYLTLIAGMIEEQTQVTYKSQTQGLDYVNQGAMDALPHWIQSKQAVDRYECKYCMYKITIEHGLSPYKHIENVPCGLGRDGHSFVLKP